MGKVIINDHIEGLVNDHKNWHNSQGSFTPNLDFIKEFLKNYYYILKKVQKNATLNDRQSLFINEFFNVNLSYLKKADTIINYI